MMKDKNRQMALAIIIGILIGTFLFPMIIIPLMGVSVVIGSLYLLVTRFWLPPKDNECEDETD